MEIFSFPILFIFLVVHGKLFFHALPNRHSSNKRPTDGSEWPTAKQLFTNDSNSDEAVRFRLQNRLKRAPKE